MSKALELRQKRANLVRQAREVIERAEAEKREMTAEEEAQWKRIIDESEKLRGQIEMEERQAALEAELSQSQGTVAAHRDPLGGGASENRANPRDTEEYRAAFRRFLLGGRESLAPEEFRALQAADKTLGGFIVAPQQFVTTLLKAVDNQVFIRQWATKFQIERAESLGEPVLDSDPADADWTTELATGSEDNSMAFGKRELTPHPVAKRIKVSNRLLRVGVQDVEALVRDRLAYKFAITHEKAFLLGNGVNQPLGVFVASSQGISTARDVSNGNTSTAITFDGLKSAKYSIKQQYWARLRWMFHRNAVEQLAKIKDSNGQYIWKDDVAEGEPDRLLGFPVFMSEYVPNTFTTGQYVGILGDFSQYQIVDALDMQIQRLVELYAETNQTGFIGRQESDGMPVMEEAFARVKLA